MSSNDEEKTFQGLTLLLKLVSNIIKNPTEDKYKKFKTTNAKISGSVLSLQGGVTELLAALGFTLQGEEYPFTVDLATLRAGNKALDTWMEPPKVARMTPEERQKHELIKEQ